MRLAYTPRANRRVIAARRRVEMPLEKKVRTIKKSRKLTCHCAPRRFLGTHGGAPIFRDRNRPPFFSAARGNRPRETRSAACHLLSQLPYEWADDLEIRCEFTESLYARDHLLKDDMRPKPRRLPSHWITERLINLEYIENTFSRDAYFFTNYPFAF